jgi:hypothetical protein
MDSMSPVHAHPQSVASQLQPVDDDDLYRPALAPKGLYLYYLVTLHTFHPVPPKSPSIVLLQFVALLCILFCEIS